MPFACYAQCYGQANLLHTGMKIDTYVFLYFDDFSSNKCAKPPKWRFSKDYHNGDFGGLKLPKRH